jgi:hypothetical protein
MARAKEMPSTQRTTPVVSPCRALVAVSIWGMRNANVTANAKFQGQERQINNFTGCSSAEVQPRLRSSQSDVARFAGQGASGTRPARTSVGHRAILALPQ